MLEAKQPDTHSTPPVGRRGEAVGQCSSGHLLENITVRGEGQKLAGFVVTERSLALIMDVEKPLHVNICVQWSRS